MVSIFNQLTDDEHEVSNQASLCSVQFNMSVSANGHVKEEREKRRIGCYPAVQAFVEVVSERINGIGYRSGPLRAMTFVVRRAKMYKVVTPDLFVKKTDGRLYV